MPRPKQILDDISQIIGFLKRTKVVVKSHRIILEGLLRYWFTRRDERICTEALEIMVSYVLFKIGAREL